MAGAVESGLLHGRPHGAGHPSPTAWAQRLAPHLRPPRLALLLGAAALGLNAAGLGLGSPWGAAPLSGTALLAASLGWMLWAAWTLRQARTTLHPQGWPQRLVDEGPFRFGRNPMYLGKAGALAGLGLALGVANLLLAAALFMVLVQVLHIHGEEARLQAALGGWYSDYARQVRRWV